MATDYSETPLAKKLGIKENYKLLIYNQPEHYFMLFSDLPEGLELIEEPGDVEVDLIHLFCTELSDLKSVFNTYKKVLKKNGSLWISWPKGSSSIPTDLKRDPIRAFVLAQGLIDCKVAAIDTDWTGLKFMYRVKDR